MAVSGNYCINRETNYRKMQNADGYEVIFILKIKEVNLTRSSINYQE